MPNLLRTLSVFALMLSMSSQAALIYPNTYRSDASNEVYWTNHDLGLDIMRLSYSDLLNADGLSSGGQATVPAVEQFLASGTDWSWATFDQLRDITAWFDTDSNRDGYSVPQFLGSRLFLDLNGVGTIYDSDNNGGYRFDGFFGWSLAIEAPSWIHGELVYSTIAGFFDDVPGGNCSHSFCGRGFETMDLYQIHQIPTVGNDGMHSTLHTFAPLLVRTASTPIPEPGTLAIFALGLLGLLSQRGTAYERICVQV